VVAVVDHVALGFGKRIEILIGIEQRPARRLYEALASGRHRVLRGKPQRAAANEAAQQLLPPGVAFDVAQDRE
jgi:hypothetical protein